MGATFGGSSNTVFGTEGPLPLLNKITTAAAIIFMLTSLLLAQLSGQDTIMKDGVAPVTAPAVEQTQDTTPLTIPMPDADKGSTPQSSEFPVEK